MNTISAAETMPGIDWGRMFLVKVWKGDHYRYIIRTEEEEDYILDSVYSWNENDLVSVSVKAEDIVLKLKKDLSEYEIKE